MTDYSNIEKLPATYIQGMKKQVQSLMGTKDSISVQDAINVFQNEHINIDPTLLSAFESKKKELNANDLSVFLMTLDGKYNEKNKTGDYDFDGRIESDNPLSDSLEHNLTRTDLDKKNPASRLFQLRSQVEVSSAFHQSGNESSTPTNLNSFFDTPSQSGNQAVPSTPQQSENETSTKPDINNFFNTPTASSKPQSNADQINELRNKGIKIVDGDKVTINENGTVTITYGGGPNPDCKIGEGSKYTYQINKDGKYEEIDHQLTRDLSK